jgi:molecular chaperone Hsp33
MPRRASSPGVFPTRQGSERSTLLTDVEMTGAEAAPGDLVLPFSVAPLDVRGRVVRLGPAVDAMLTRHAYPPAVSRLLGEAIALTALLGSSLKFDGRFTLQTSTDGPVDLIVVDFSTPDALRAYARFDADRVAAVTDGVSAGSRPDGGLLLGKGHLAMTVDQGTAASRYQGIVPLDRDGLEAAAHRYFEQSEQIPTRVRLAVAEVMSRRPGEAPAHAWRAGGILVQFLPEAPERLAHRDLNPGDRPEGGDEDAVTDDDTSDDDAWVEARALVETVEDIELTDPEVTPERLLYRLFHERGVRVFEPQPMADRCRCSRERVAGVLRGFSPEERADMVVDGAIEVTCEFCSTRYHFAAEEVED